MDSMISRLRKRTEEGWPLKRRQKVNGGLFQHGQYQSKCVSHGNGSREETNGPGRRKGQLHQRSSKEGEQDEVRTQEEGLAFGRRVDTPFLVTGQRADVQPGHTCWHMWRWEVELDVSHRRKNSHSI